MKKIYDDSDSNNIFGSFYNEQIFISGGGDFIDAGTGDDDIFGSSDGEVIYAGDGNDNIFANGGGDFIDTGAGDDYIWLGTNTSTVFLETGTGYDTIDNFQLGATKLQLGSLDNISLTDNNNGVEIFQEGDLLAFISWQSVSSFSSNFNNIFIS